MFYLNTSTGQTRQQIRGSVNRRDGTVWVLMKIKWNRLKCFCRVSNIVNISGDAQSKKRLFCPNEMSLCCIANKRRALVMDPVTCLQDLAYIKAYTSTSPLSNDVLLVRSLVANIFRGASSFTCMPIMSSWCFFLAKLAQRSDEEKVHQSWGRIKQKGAGMKK